LSKKDLTRSVWVRIVRPADEVPEKTRLKTADEALLAAEAEAALASPGGVRKEARSRLITGRP
jgi:hypothetical protein